MNLKAFFTVRRLTYAALLVALDIVFTRVFSFMFPGSIDRLSLQFLAHAAEGMLLGPVGAALAAVAGDLIGTLINSGGMSFYLPLTVSALMRGVLYGLFFYKKPASFVRVLLACAAVTLIVDLGWNPIFLAKLYGQPYGAVFLAKLPVRLVWIPVSSVVLYFVTKALFRAVPAFRDGL